MTEGSTACLLCGVSVACRRDEACWCKEETVDARLLRWLKATGRSGHCLCRACLRGHVPSPCLSLCAADEGSDQCSGCGRTLDEIGRWSCMSSIDRAAVWLRLKGRDATSAQ